MVAAICGGSPCDITPPAGLGFMNPLGTLTAAITQAFGIKSVTGILHRGIDYSVPTGTPVYAADTGTVTLTYRNGYVSGIAGDGSPGGYGNQVRMQDGLGVETRYGHLSSVGVNEGDSVVAGTLIGYSGATGIATGPHLHFEADYGGDAFDPSSFLGKAVHGASKLVTQLIGLHDALRQPV